MKIGTARMWKLLVGDETMITVNGKPFYCEMDAKEGVTFRYGKKKLFISNEKEENLVRNNTECQKLCDRVNKYFKID